MTQAAKAQEPTMEEILASIRRIIADDDAKPPASVSAAPSAAAPPTPPRQSAPPQPPVAPTPAPVAESKPLKQDGIDMMLSELEERKEPTIIGSEPPDVLDLTESMVAPAPSPAPAGDANFKTIDGEPDVIFRETDPEPPPPEVEAVSAKPIPEAPRAVSPPERSLLSNATTAAVDSAFNTLAHTVLVQNARTLEDLVREMLRPLLKSWLDDNLPGIVERMVKAEIERVSRGRS
jgi:uncharacterized protein